MTELRHIEDIAVEDDAPREECGVFAVYGESDSFGAAGMTLNALFGIQHRGQESAGIAVSNGRTISVHKGMGLVREAFTEEDVRRLEGFMAIGHVRYSTAGKGLSVNAQPIKANTSLGTIAIAHNGSLVNADALLSELKSSGAVFESASDAEIILNLMARSGRAHLPEALRDACAKIVGSYALVLLTPESITALRDPMGNRPLCLGRAGNTYLVASESCALNTVGAKLIRDVEPGELITLDANGLHSVKLLESKRKAICAVEYVYFARPDSELDGKVVHLVRKEMGRQLARESKVEADVVIPVPDSGWSTALGFSEESSIPLDIGLSVNRYVGRTFIQPKQELRNRGVTLKLTPIDAVIRGKRVAMIDDSIVRGTTSGILVNLLREAGAAEVHMLISSPPWRFPCSYGIDVAAAKELVASSHSVEEIRRFINADSLHYLSLEGLCEAIGRPANEICLACFTGEAPTDNLCPC
ncbi:MAG: amidophosphoribosyltransferase [Bacillota bacterium]|nr:amidophosphoribosyltransferase [Bacillota bacterium]HPZ54232.1 amidophosphoribosyltransferase [Bacillota bacterium]HQD18710.1 amidophosphoribosyltransferase [Bacillota bacterium]